MASTASAPAPGHSTQGPLAWNTVVSQLASQRHLELLDTARIHALVSMAVSHAFAEAHRCTACLAGAAVRMVLDAEFGADAAGDAIGRDVLVQWTPVRAAE